MNGVRFTATDEDLPGLLDTNFIGYRGIPTAPTSWWGAANGASFAGGAPDFYRGPPTGDVDLDNLLNSHAWLFNTSTTSTSFGMDGVVTIMGLDAGAQYIVQLVGIVDDRVSVLRPRTYVVDDGTGSFVGGPTLSRRFHEVVVGRFQADGPTQEIRLRSLEPVDDNRDPGLSAIIVLEVPESSVFTSVLFGCLALLIRRANRVPVTDSESQPRVPHHPA